MPRRVPPSPEQTAQAINDSTGWHRHATPVAMRRGERAFLSLQDAIEVIRTRFGTTRAKAKEWLYAAHDAGAVVIIRSAANGRHLSRLAPYDPAKFHQGERRTGEDAPKYMLDTLTNEDSFLDEGILDSQGDLHLVKKLHESLAPAPDASYWVATPADVAEVVRKMQQYSSEVLLESQATRIVKDAAVDHHYGDSIAIIQALFHHIGRDSDLTVEPRLMEGRGDKDSYVVVDMRLAGAEIDQLAARLRLLGVTPDTVWND